MTFYLHKATAKCLQVFQEKNAKKAPSYSGEQFQGKMMKNAQENTALKNSKTDQDTPHTKHRKTMTTCKGTGSKHHRIAGMFT